MTCHIPGSTTEMQGMEVMQVLLQGIFHLGYIETEQLWWQKTFKTTPPCYFLQQSKKIFFFGYKTCLPIYGTIYTKSKYKGFIFLRGNMFWSQKHPISCIVTWFLRQSYELHLQCNHFRCFICICPQNKMNTLIWREDAHSDISENSHFFPSLLVGKECSHNAAIL